MSSSRVASPAAAWLPVVAAVPRAVLEAVAAAPAAAAQRHGGWLDEPVPYRLTTRALEALGALPARLCGACHRAFPVLVDDSGLCITCDSLLYPPLEA